MAIDIESCRTVLLTHLEEYLAKMSQENCPFDSMIISHMIREFLGRYTIFEKGSPIKNPGTNWFGDIVVKVYNRMATLLRIS